MESLQNRFVYSAEISNLQPGQTDGVAIALGVGNDLRRLRVHSVKSCGVGLVSAHRLSIFENRDIVPNKPTNPELGAHRDRPEGNLSPAVKQQFGMDDNDFGVFHPPGNFTDGQGGGRLESTLSAPDGAELGEWLLDIEDGFAFVAVENLSGAQGNFSIRIEFSFTAQPLN
jgi:hypothetical protein